MLVAGLTGGIGSGKTTFAKLLGDLGAEVIDADELGRAALRTGEPAWHSVVDQFGDDILTPGDLAIDRKRLAAIVFNDRDKLAALNAIVHPVILAGIADTLDALAGTDEIVVIDAALIVELGLARGLDAIIVMTADEAKRSARLVKARGMSPDQVRARIASQAAEADLLGKADIVVPNDGDLDDLEKRATEVWERLCALRESRNQG